MDVPNVVRREYSLIHIDDGFLSLMLDDGSTKDDVKLPEGAIGAQMETELENGKELLVTVVAAMGEEHALSCKLNGVKWGSPHYTNARAYSQGGSQINPIYY